MDGGLPCIPATASEQYLDTVLFLNSMKDLDSTTLSNLDDLDGLVLCEITRNGVLLVTAGSTSDDDAIEAARELSQCPVTPGFEFWVPPSWRRAPTTHRRLHGLKFHVHDHYSNDDDENEDSSKEVLWVYAIVYDRHRLTPLQVQRWMEVLVEATAESRDRDDVWRFGGRYSAQQSFGPALLKFMRERAYHEKKRLLEARVDSLRAVMQRNIETLLDREERIERLHERANSLEDLAKVFRKRARSLRRYHKWQHAKYGLLVGTTVTAAVAVVAVPLAVIVF